MQAKKKKNEPSQMRIVKEERHASNLRQQW